MTFAYISNHMENIVSPCPRWTHSTSIYSAGIQNALLIKCNMVYSCIINLLTLSTSLRYDVTPKALWNTLLIVTSHGINMALRQGVYSSCVCCWNMFIMHFASVCFALLCEVEFQVIKSMEINPQGKRGRYNTLPLLPPRRRLPAFLSTSVLSCTPIYTHRHINGHQSTSTVLSTKL